MLTDTREDIQVSVVIPVYRAGQTLIGLSNRLIEMMGVQRWSFEIIFVEDCGGDNSWQVIAELAQHNPDIRGIRLSRNYGQHNALLCGIRAARGDVIITMDDDLQHPPGEIPKLIETLDEGYEVVYGAPIKEPHGLLRALAGKITRMVLKKSMGAETARYASAFRAFRAGLRDAFHGYLSPSVNIDVMLTWATVNFGVVKVRHDPRTSGTSGYTVRALMRHAFNMATGFSAVPLQLASITGFIFALFGLLVLLYVLITFFVFGSSVQGFAFLASIIAIFSGAQLLALGIFGEYLARIHFRTMDQPAYIVKETSFDNPTDNKQ